jgi:outer membrane murein-binding lipoprotein Lpp
MTLKAVLDNLDALDSKYHDLYTEKDGKFVLGPVEGMRSEADVQRLTTSLTKERDEHKATKAKFSPFVGMDIAEVTTKLARVDELEILVAGKPDDAKIEQIVSTRLAAKTAPLERERDALKGQVTTLTGEVATFKQDAVIRSVHDGIREAAIKHKVEPGAIEDALLLGERVFEVDDLGHVVTGDRRGVTPGLNPEQWLADVLTKKPHWVAPSGGGGARGPGDTGGGVNPFTKDGWNMTLQGQLLRTDRARAERMAKAAGTSIGGPRPAK